MAMLAAADRAARVCSAVERHHANATLQLPQAGPAIACIHETEQPDSPFADVVTKPVHGVSVWLADVAGALSEGDTVTLTTREWPQGRACRISTPVDIDASGWAQFQVNPV